jgi:hypothetical protein
MACIIGKLILYAKNNLRKPTFHLQLLLRVSIVKLELPRRVTFTPHLRS